MQKVSFGLDVSGLDRLALTASVGDAMNNVWLLELAERARIGSRVGSAARELTLSEAGRSGPGDVPCTELRILDEDVACERPCLL